MRRMFFILVVLCLVFTACSAPPPPTPEQFMSQRDSLNTGDVLVSYVTNDKDSAKTDIVLTVAPQTTFINYDELPPRTKKSFIYRAALWTYPAAIDAITAAACQELGDFDLYTSGPNGPGVIKVTCKK